jgi:uncharacterized membrane protein YecN with MAPEG domain
MRCCGLAIFKKSRHGAPTVEELMITTSIYAALLTLMLIVLSVNVIRRRAQFASAMGSDDQFLLRRAVRARANFIEYAPVFVIISAMLEYQGFPSAGIHAFGLTFLAGRGMHAYSLLVAERYIKGKLAAKPIWRIRGMKCTLNVLGILAIALLLRCFMNIFHA